MKKEKEPAIGMEKMTDAELSKILGRYQAAESIGIFLGALCVIAGCVLAFVLHELIVVLVLGFSGVVLLLLIALPAQKKKNTHKKIKSWKITYILH